MDGTLKLHHYYPANCPPEFHVRSFELKEEDAASEGDADNHKGTRPKPGQAAVTGGLVPSPGQSTVTSSAVACWVSLLHIAASDQFRINTS